MVSILEIIFFPLYTLKPARGDNKEGYSERYRVSRDEEQKLIDEGIKVYKDYEKETVPIKKKQKGEKLSQIYSTLLRINPNFFKDGIPDDIKRRMAI